MRNARALSSATRSFAATGSRPPRPPRPVMAWARTSSRARAVAAMCRTAGASRQRSSTAWARPRTRPCPCLSACPSPAKTRMAGPSPTRCMETSSTTRPSRASALKGASRCATKRSKASLPTACLTHCKSPRIAPQIIGVGLLEAIAEADILANAADQAAAPGPIKGQANKVWDAPSGSMMTGRFGWKANVATIALQTGGAFLGDMGITSRHFAHETCTPAQKDCLAAPSGKSGKEGASVQGQPAVEIDDKTLADVIFYQATLAPPARRNVNDVQVQRGQALFAQAQCATCHRPSYVTKEGPFPTLTSKALNGQRI